MTAYFKKLFSIELQHSYYAGNLTPDIAIEVEKNTSAVFRNLRLISQLLPGKIVVHYEAKDAAGTPRVLPGRFVPLTFFLTLRTSAFMNHTQLPAFGQNAFYFSNFDLDGSKRLPTNGSTILLHDEANYVQAIPEEAEFSVSGPGLNSVKLARFMPVNGFTELQSIDIHSRVARGKFPQTGLFQLTRSAPTTQSLHYSDAAVVYNKPFAILQIWLGADTDYHTPVNYAVRWEKP